MKIAVNRILIQISWTKCCVRDRCTNSWFNSKMKTRVAIALIHFMGWTFFEFTFQMDFENINHNSRRAHSFSLQNFQFLLANDVGECHFDFNLVCRWHLRQRRAQSGQPRQQFFHRLRLFLLLLNFDASCISCPFVVPNGVCSAFAWHRGAGFICRGP